jgi:hypothetical protein
MTQQLLLVQKHSSIPSVNEPAPNILAAVVFGTGVFH